MSDCTEEILADELAALWYKQPTFKALVSATVVRDIMLSRQGKILANGHFYWIKSKHVAPGTYEIWLEEK